MYWATPALNGPSLMYLSYKPTFECRWSSLGVWHRTCRFGKYRYRWEIYTCCCTCVWCQEGSWDCSRWSWTWELSWDVDNGYLMLEDWKWRQHRYMIHFFRVRLCRFCLVIPFFHPRHDGQWPPISKDFYSR